MRFTQIAKVVVGTALGILAASVGEAQVTRPLETDMQQMTKYSFASAVPSSGAPAQMMNVSLSAGSTDVGVSTSNYPLSIAVGATTRVILSTRFVVTVTHPSVPEVQILLVAPSGDKIELMQNHDAGGYVTQAASGDTFVFDSRATVNGSGAYGGYMRPNTAAIANTYPAPAPAGPYSKNLANLVGDNPTGTWNFYCHDNVPGNGNSGTISISMEVETIAVNVTSGDAGAGAPYPLNISASGITGTYHDLRLKLNNLSHTNPDDMRLLLVAPSGEKLMLMNNCGGSGDITNQDMTFAHSARSMTDSLPLITTDANVFAPTTYDSNGDMPPPAPTGPYATTFPSAFAAATLNGNWQLYFADDTAAETGFFDSATLEIVTSDDLGILGSLDLNGETTIVPAGSSTGWSNFGLTPSSNWVVTSTNSGYYDFPISAHPTKLRTSGLIRNRSGWLPLSTPVLRELDYFCLFSVGRSGQPNAADLNQIPNLRMRMQQRFAANSMLEVFHHTGDNASQTAMEQELRPCDYNQSYGSNYLVGISPIFTPRSTASSEGLQCAFEAFATLPQDLGSLRLQNILLTSVKRASYPTDTVPKKDFRVAISDAGTLKVYNAAAELQNYALNFGAAADDPPVLAAGDGGTYSENQTGITLSTDGQTSTPPVRVVSRNIHPEGGGTAYTSRARVVPDHFYTARFHVTATRIAPLQSQVRFRMRTIKFAYSQKLEIGGVYAAGSLNNALARQFAPGFGTLNFDKRKETDPGTWYTMLMYGPMTELIRPEFSSGTPLTTRMPNITAQPGPGAAAASRRDIFLGLDVLDTLSTAVGFENEASQLTIDQITLHEFFLIPPG